MKRKKLEKLEYENMARIHGLEALLEDAWKDEAELLEKLDAAK